MKKKRKNLNETIRTGKYKNLINPAKQKHLESGVETILGALPENAQEYYDALMSDTYIKCLERMEHYLGLSPETQGISHEEYSVDLFWKLVMGGLRKIERFETGHKSKLEDLALECVLECPEFESVRELFYRDKIRFDIQLGNAELQNAISKADQFEEEDDVEDDGGLSPIEIAGLEVAKGMMGDEEIKLRRRLANTLTQGTAINKLYLFNTVKEQLDEINPHLVYLYGLVCAIVQIMYFAQAMGFEKAAAQSGLGSEEVTEDEEENEEGQRVRIFTIKARGTTFPFLVHEIVKGIYEYLSLRQVTRQEMRNDTLEDETTDILAGPELWKRISALVPYEKQNLLPRIYQDLIDMPIDQIKKVFAGGGHAQAIINAIIKKEQEEREAYEAEDEEPYEDEGY